MINKEFQSILWEYNLKKLNYDDDIVFIRSLTIWDLNHIKYMKSKLWKEKFIEKFLGNIEKLDKKTINYWGTIYWINTKKYINNIQNTYEKLNKPIFTRNIGWK